MALEELMTSENLQKPCIFSDKVLNSSTDDSAGLLNSRKKEICS